MKWYEITASGDGPAVVSIFGEIGWDVEASEFLAEFAKLSGRDIKVLLSSPGGNVFQGLDIFNAIKSHDGNVDVEIGALAASMGSVIPMAANGTVSMHETGIFMVHGPSTGAYGTAEEMQKVVEALDTIKQVMKVAYGRTGMSDEDLDALLATETYYTATEAKEKGFVDEVIKATDAQLDIAACLTGTRTNFENAPNIITQALGSLTLFPDVPQPSAVVTPQPAAPAAPKSTEVDMTEEEKAAALAEARAAGIKAEAERRTNITAVLNGHRATLGDGYQALLDGLLEDPEATESSAKDAVLAALKEKQPKSSTGGVVVVEDARDKFRAGASLAIQGKMGVRDKDGKRVDDSRNEYRSMTAFELAKACAVQAGVDISGLNRLQIVGAAFTHGSSDLPLLFEDSVNKTLQAAYAETEDNFSAISDTGSVSDFKLHSRLRMGSFNNLDTVPEGAEFKHGTIEEEREQISAQTKGKLISFTRQMIINDDMSSLSRISQMMGRAAKRTVEADGWALLQSGTSGDGPTMADGNQLFSTPHGNRSAASFAFNVANLSAIKAAMSKQKFSTSDAAFLNIRPSIVVCPVELEDVVRTLLASETDPSQDNSKKPNIHRNSLTVVSSPYLTDPSDFYLFADPSQAPVLEVVYLDGVQEPFLDSEQGFTIDGITWKVRLDYGVGATDYRGAYRAR